MKKIIALLILLSFPVYSDAASSTYSASFVAASSQNLYVNSGLGLTIGGNITEEMWFKPASTPTGGAAYVLFNTGNIGNVSPYVRYSIRYADVSGTPKLRFNRERTCVSNNFTDYAITLNVGQWYHIAMTYDGTNITGYVDGVVVAGPTAQSGNGTSLCPDTFYTSIGAIESDTFINFMDGSIDDVRVWSSARSTANILANKCTIIDTSSGLVASWHLDNALTDSSGGGFTLTNNNSSTFTTNVPSCLAGVTATYQLWPFSEF